VNVAILAVAGALIAVAYVFLLLLPAWRSYSKPWERLSAAFLTLYMLAAFIGVGIALGALAVWSYAQLG
jgi:hypothetical protein